MLSIQGSAQVGQVCYEEKIELNTDFSKICITPNPPGAPMGKVPLTNSLGIGTS